MCFGKVTTTKETIEIITYKISFREGTLNNYSLLEYLGKIPYEAKFIEAIHDDDGAGIITMFFRINKVLNKK